MLVLSRQRDETIMIGDDVQITIVDIRGDKVRLGITAPTKVAVHRKEVYDAIKAENERAAQIAGGDLGAVRSVLSQPLRPRTGIRPVSGATPIHAVPVHGAGGNGAMGGGGGLVDATKRTG